MYEIPEKNKTIIKDSLSFDRGNVVITKSLIELYENKDNLSPDTQIFVDKMAKRLNNHLHVLIKPKLKNIFIFKDQIRDILLSAYMIFDMTSDFVYMEVPHNVSYNSLLLLDAFYGETIFDILGKIANKTATRSRSNNNKGYIYEQKSPFNILTIVPYMTETNLDFITSQFDESQNFFIKRVLSGDYKYSLFSEPFGGGFSIVNFVDILQGLDQNPKSIIKSKDFLRLTTEWLQSGKIPTHHVVVEAVKKKKNLDSKYFFNIVKLSN